MSSRSGSSRRKPLVTRKVYDKSSDEDEEEVKSNGVNGDSKSDAELDLPEGTVVVKPEAVEDKGTGFKGPEFTSGKRKSTDPNFGMVTCTACHKQINTNKKGSARRHPELKVLLCKRCREYHESGPISQDDDGLDEQCRWCSEGGRLFGCDYCHNAFCRSCIIHNLGRSEIMNVEGEDKWKCYVCNPRPLYSLMKKCNDVLAKMKEEDKKRKQKEKDEKQKKTEEAAKKREEKEKEKSEKKSEKNTPSRPDAQSRSNSSSKPVVQPASKPSVPTASKTGTPSNIKTIIINASSAKTANCNQPNVSSVGGYRPIMAKPTSMLANALTMPSVNSGRLPQMAFQQMNNTQSQPRTTSTALPALFAQFRQNVNANNVVAVMDKLLKSTSLLNQLVSSIRANVSSSNVHANQNTTLASMSMQSRRTAVECLMNGMELFLQELQILICGTSVDFKSFDQDQKAQQPKVPDVKTPEVDLTGDSATSNSVTSEIKVKKEAEPDQLDSSCVILDSDSEIETCSPKKKVNSGVEIEKESVVVAKEQDTEKSTVVAEDSTKDNTEASLDKIIELADKMLEDEKESKAKSPVDKTKSASEAEDKETSSTEMEVMEVDGLSDVSEEADPKSKKRLFGESDCISGKDKKESITCSKESDVKKKNKSDNENKKSSKQVKKSDDLDSSTENSDDNNLSKNNDTADNIETIKEEDVNDEVSSEEEDSDDSDDETSSDEDSGHTKRRSLRKRKKEDKKKGKEAKQQEKKKGKGSCQKLKIKLAPLKGKSEKKKKEDQSNKKDSEKKKKEDRKSDKKDEKKSKGKNQSVESDSSNFNSDLEEEIDKLSKTPEIKKRTTRSSTISSQDESESVSEKPKEKDKKKKEKKERKKKKGAKKSSGSGEESSNDNTDDYDHDEGCDDDIPMNEDDNPDDESEKADEEDINENEKAKEDLLKELDSSSDTEQSDQSSDSEVIINSPKKKKKKVAAKGKAKNEDSGDSDSDFVKSPKKKLRLRSKLLDAKLTESDSDSDIKPRTTRGKKRKAETESSQEDVSEESEEESEETEEEEDTDTDSKSKKKKGKGKKGGKAKGKGKKEAKGKKRRRIRAPVDSSDDEEKMSTEGEEEENEKQEGDSDEGDSPSKGKRKKIRKVLSDKKLTDKTKAAVKAEEERRKRVTEKQKLFNNVETVEDPSSPTKCPITKKLVLEMNEETKEPVIEVVSELVTKLKPHQVEAVQFIWDCTIESVARIKKEKGAGCILAHCMGLGKTLSVITYLYTVMKNSDITKMNKVLVVSPLNTVLNWQYEFEMWIESFDEEFYEVFELSSVKQNFQRADLLKHWQKHGGIMIIGYEMFRNLSQGHHCRSKKMKETFLNCLVDPGPDIIVCDEGHIIKNDASAISKSINKVKTLRRIVLTGTPLQNNLSEYHCMVDFVKPNLLGTRKEFCNRFVNPITNGQCADSTSHDVRVMKRRAHILHEKLAGCVQRRDYSALVKFLSPKYEYVIAVRLTKVQIALYEKYLDVSRSESNVVGKGAKLFSDYQNLMRIWTHPWVLKMDEIRQSLKARWDDDDEDSFIDDDENSNSSSDSASLKSSSSDSEDEVIPLDSDNEKSKDTKESDESKKKSEIVKKWTTRSRGGEGGEWDIPEEEFKRPFSTEWWAEYVTEDDEWKMETSGKLILLFEILKMSEEIGDKVLVFSQSLLSLDLIERFLERVDEVHQAETAKKDEEDAKKEEEEKAKKKKDKKKGNKDKKEDNKDDKDDKEEKDEKVEPQEVFGKHWTKGEDYFRMDGSTSAQRRKDLAATFNDPENYKARLFLISTKAGGLGINLVAANRVIIFDASWNPSHDVQSIFRVYRFGQTKPVYVYRFLAQGTMEEKIYERQVTKQSLSQRVVDEHQIERHFTAQDLQELYTFTPDRLDDPNRKERPTPELPKDHMLAELLKSMKDHIVNYHVHDSLLENQIDQELTEEERKAAWSEYEEEKKGIVNNVRQSFMNTPYMQQMMMSGGNVNPNNVNVVFPPNMQMPMQMPGMPGGMSLNQSNLLQLVQDMKAKYPHLPEDQLTARVQSVIRQIITNQFLQQQDVQRRQLEQRELQHQQQLHQIQAQIQRQQQQLQRMPASNMPSSSSMIRPPQRR